MRVTTWFLVWGLATSEVFGGGKHNVDGAREMALRHVFENRAIFGLIDPTQELREQQVIPVHESVIFRYDQLHRGVPVFGVQLIVVVKANDITVDDKALRRNLQVGTKPAISREVATAVALRAAKVTNGYRQPQPRLVILPSKGFGNVPVHDVLTWAVDVYAVSETEGVKDLTVFIDAKTAEFVVMTSHMAEVDQARGVPGPR